MTVLSTLRNNTAVFRNALLHQYDYDTILSLYKKLDEYSLLTEKDHTKMSKRRKELHNINNQFYNKAQAILDIFINSYQEGMTQITQEYLSRNLDIYMFLKGESEVGLKSLLGFLSYNKIIEQKTGERYAKWWKLVNFDFKPDDFINITKYQVNMSIRIISSKIPDSWKMRDNKRTFIDRTGFFSFEKDGFIEETLHNLKSTIDGAKYSENPVYITEMVALTVRTIIESLTLSHKKPENVGFGRWFQKHFNINNRSDFFRFINKSWSHSCMLLHERKRRYYQDNCGSNKKMVTNMKMGLISYFITTLYNFFTTDDIKRFGYNLDCTEIISIIQDIKKTWKTITIKLLPEFTELTDHSFYN